VYGRIVIVRPFDVKLTRYCPFGIERSCTNMKDTIHGDVKGIPA